MIDEFDGKRVLIALDKKTMSALAFHIGKRKLTRKGEDTVDETGRVWFLTTGRSKDGKGVLEMVPLTPWTIVRWKGFYPRGDVYKQPTAPR